MSVVSQIVAFVIQGAVITLIALFIYTADKHGFWIGGEPRTKEEAQLIIAIFFFVTGAVGSILISTIQDILIGFNPIQVLGLAAIVTRWTINEMIDGWRHFDDKSKFVYGISFLIIIGPEMV